MSKPRLTVPQLAASSVAVTATPTPRCSTLHHEYLTLVLVVEWLVVEE